MFGDADPEDAYDEGDSLNEKLVILGRALVAITEDGDSERALLRLAWVRHKLDGLTGG